MSRTRFRVNPHCIVARISRNPLLKAGTKSKVYMTELDSNSEPLNLGTNTQGFAQMGQMIKLCSEYLSVRSI